MASDPHFQSYVRIRPTLPREAASALAPCVTASSLGFVTVVLDGDTKTMAFDAAFPATASQEDVFSDAVQPVVDHFVGGGDGAVVAYGPQVRARV